MKQVLTFGNCETYSNREVLQRVYYKEVEVGALITNKGGILREYFISINLRRKTIDDIRADKGCELRKLRVDESETNGFYEIVYHLDDRKKYCDLLSLARRIYKRIRPIYCANCGSLLFYTDAKTEAVAGAFEADLYGYVYKMPFLFNSAITNAFYCNKSCWSKWLEKNSDEKTRQEAKRFTDELKREMPSIVEKAAKGASTLHSMLMEMKMSKDGAKRFAEIVKNEQARQEFINDFIQRNK